MNPAQIAVVLLLLGWAGFLCWAFCFGEGGLFRD